MLERADKPYIFIFQNTREYQIQKIKSKSVT